MKSLGNVDRSEFIVRKISDEMIICVTMIPSTGVLDYLEHIHRPENRVILLHVIELPDLAHASELHDNIPWSLIQAYT